MEVTMTAHDIRTIVNISQRQFQYWCNKLNINNNGGWRRVTDEEAAYLVLVKKLRDVGLTLKCAFNIVNTLKEK